ncbi:MAG: hypothetical protein NT157_01920 [Candidatus Micrarchaeota archaeon]|nr:hypothetical protein [Candidatus Micrarchaeota archaeon]
MENYFKETKERLGRDIPSYDSVDFKKLSDNIRKELQKEENEYGILVRHLKILLLGDWYTQEKKRLLDSIKNNLLANGLYAETIDGYYDVGKKDSLNQIQILYTCCVKHQLMVFVDGSGAGTITEQNFLRQYYSLQGKTIFFIEQKKFDKLKEKPSEYIGDFPTIITYKKPELLDKVLVYSRFRIHRLARIIHYQKRHMLGLTRPEYKPWSQRLSNQ